MKKILQVLNAVALIFTIVINYLSNTGVFNGKTVANISDQSVEKTLATRSVNVSVIC